MRAMQIITYVCGGLAALMLLATFTATNGAPQEAAGAAGAAMALAVVAIPYCITATMQRSRLISGARE